MVENVSPGYTNPATVLSPKGSVSNVRVLRNTGLDGYAVASLDWEGRPSLGIRWNGHPKNPIGNPQSRGIPTWFVVPAEVEPAVRAALGVSHSGAIELIGEVTRVRVRPLPLRIWQGTREAPMDDEWVLSITDRAQGRMEIMNPRTGHFMAVDQAQVLGLAHDTMRDQPHGPKHGILSLNVQMVFEDGQLTLEAPQSLMDRIERLSANMQGTGYAGHEDQVRGLIQQARIELVRPNQSLGPWESECLDYADAAVAANFLQLALASIAKAIAVRRLPANDYEYGFNYPRRDTASAPSP